MWRRLRGSDGYEDKRVRSSVILLNKLSAEEIFFQSGGHFSPGT
jgi:hypothetical protein